MDNICISFDYKNIENSDFEVVERKGVGHPDTLADALAEECSRVYSKYCLKQFGAVLHHNLDKFYIGGGLFESDFGYFKKVKPINIVSNGRISNRIGDSKIDISNLLTNTIKEYVGVVLPNVDVENDLNIQINATQNTRISNWFSPNDLRDVPDSNEVFANDTSVVTAYYPLTTCEELAIKMERFFWDPNDKLYPVPKFDNVGQDIKVMIVRNKRHVDIIMCVPIIATKAKTEEIYFELINQYEKELTEYAKAYCEPKGYDVNVVINSKFSNEKMGTKYLLVKGTSAECGEEGLVGRGNNILGIIPLYRPNSMEAGAGKNPRYHTGRVLSYVAKELSKKIYEETNSGCNVSLVTRNKYSLIPPYQTIINMEKNVEVERIKMIVKEFYKQNDFTERILEHRNYV